MSTGVVVASLFLAVGQLVMSLLVGMYGLLIATMSSSPVGAVWILAAGVVLVASVLTVVSLVRARAGSRRFRVVLTASAMFSFVLGIAVIAVFAGSFGTSVGAQDAFSLVTDIGIAGSALSAVVAAVVVVLLWFPLMRPERNPRP